MILIIRNSFWTKVVAVFLALNLIGEFVFPTIAFGLNGGPIGVDQSSFEPASTSEMVDMSTGDFVYNIPLLDVDGYPINLSYHGGVTMEQDASCVGLGWTINVGSMNRAMRGLPDDFDGDEVVTEMNMRPQFEIGGTSQVTGEVVGFDALKFGFGLGHGFSFNNYRGVSHELFTNGALGSTLPF
jgi:hypothetical protein